MEKNGSDCGSRYVVNRIQLETNRIIERAKSKYMSDLGRKVSNPTSGSKVFWGAFNNLINKKKITNIPPLLENGTYVSDFGVKAEIFNKYFAQQCRPLQNGSVLPRFEAKTPRNLSTILIVEENIANIIKKPMAMTVFQYQR